MLPFGRATRRLLWDRQPRESDPTREKARRVLYGALMRVSIRHSFYNRSGGICPDFTAGPTPSSASLMADLGLLFRADSDGFSILYDENRTSALLNYLRRQQGVDGRIWTRLSFVLWLNNPDFVNFTNLPIDTNPTVDNLYFSNRQAHWNEKKDRILLNEGEHVTAGALLRVAPSQIQASTPKGIQKIVVRAVSGEEVLCKPRCVPVRLLESRPPDAITCKEVEGWRTSPPGDRQESPPGGKWLCRDMVYLDFAALPQGKHTIEWVRCPASPAAANRKQEILNTSHYPMTFCFVDLLFTDPGSDRRSPSPLSPPQPPGIYPVRGLAGSSPLEEPRIVPVDYTLQFERRSTIWNYYIVPPPLQLLRNLRIYSDPPGIRFAGPCKVRLPTGGQAYRFASKRKLPLEERSELHLKLLGQTCRMEHNRVLLTRLPAPSAQQVTPAGEACLELGRSLDLEAVDGRCRSLVRRVCGGAWGCRVQDCLACMERLRSPPGDERCLNRLRSCSECCDRSDIYVYV